LSQFRLPSLNTPTVLNERSSRHFTGSRQTHDAASDLPGARNNADGDRSHYRWL
jgi:hypothetical protein